MSELRPFELVVLDRLTAVLKGIAVADGFSQDINDAVFRGRAYFGENDPLPMLSLLQDPRLFEILMGPEASTTSAGDVNLVLQGFVEDDPENPTDPAYFLLADAKMALAAERSTNGGSNRNLLGFGAKKPCVTDMKWGRGVVRPPDEISMKAYFWLPITLTLVEDDANPFTLV